MRPQLCSLQWLGELLRCFNKGDIEQFNMLVDTYSSEYFAQPALKVRSPAVRKCGHEPMQPSFAPLSPRYRPLPRPYP